MPDNPFCDLPHAFLDVISRLDVTLDYFVGQTSHFGINVPLIRQAVTVFLLNQELQLA